MTKNHTTVEFTIEPLENRDAPKLGLGAYINGGPGTGSLMRDYGDMKKTIDGLGPGFNFSWAADVS